MKRILSILFAALVVVGAKAQTLVEEGPQFGVRVAWDLNSPITNLYKSVEPFKNGSGVSFGAFYTLPIVTNFYFEPGVSFFYNTMIINPEPVAEFVSDYPVPYEGSLRNYGFRVPFHFGYQFPLTDDMALSVFTGPQLNIGLSMKEYDNATNKSASLYGNGWHRLDAQWMIGVRFHYADNWIAEISGGVGMTNLLSGDMAKNAHFRRNMLTIGVGYMF